MKGIFDIFFKKVMIMNRLLTGDNLLKSHVLPIDEQLCTRGCRCNEDREHLFVSCNFFLAIFGMLFAVGRRFFGIFSESNCTSKPVLLLQRFL